MQCSCSQVSKGIRVLNIGSFTSVRLVFQMIMSGHIWIVMVAIDPFTNPFLHSSAKKLTFKTAYAYEAM